MIRGAGAVGALVLLCVSTGAAWGQDRAPAARQALVDLAGVLGQSHAIRQACTRQKDFRWRERMQRLLQVEAADQSLKNRAMLSFNDGFYAAKASYPACSKEAKAAAARLAQRGEKLAVELGS